MTKEELRKEATTTVEWECTPMIERPIFINGYITSAEPREKRIVELEKENAELQEKLKPENCLKLLAKKGYVKFTSDKLTKAKELIEELSSSLSVVGECGEEECELLNRAEQFLKDSVE